MPLNVIIWGLLGLHCAAAQAQAFNPLNLPQGISSVESEYAVRIEPTTFKQSLLSELQQNLSEVQFAIPDTDITSGIPGGGAVKIRGIRALFHSYSSEIGNGPSAGTYQIVAQQNTMDIYVNSVTLDETVTTHFDGITATIDIHASCTNLHAHFSDAGSQLQATLTPSINGSELNATLQNPLVHLGTPSIDSWVSSCTGAKGFEALLQQSVEDRLLKPGSISDFAQATLAQKLNDYASTVHFNWKTPEAFSSTTNLNPTSLHLLPDGTWFMTGLVQMNFPAFKTTQVHFNFQKAVEPNLVPINSVVMPEQGLLEWLKGTIVPLGHSLTGRANDIDGFRHFLKNKLACFFLWPDLLNYTNENSFTYAVLPQSDIQVEWVNQQDLKISTVFNLGLYVDQKPYVQWLGPASANLKITLNQQQFLIHPDQVSLNGQYRWLEGFHGYIASPTLESNVEQALGALELHQAVPTLQISPTSHLILKDYSRNSTEHTVTLNLEQAP